MRGGFTILKVLLLFWAQVRSQSANTQKKNELANE